MGVQIREDRWGVATLTISPSTVAAQIGAEQTFTLPGVKINDIIVVQKRTVQAGLFVGGARVTAANTIGVNFVNASSASILPTASETYDIFVFRPETSVTGAFNP